ncbi:MAG: 4Fe-4S dicluster domain-containing protein [Candidatus Obscuribacterales bacterium]|nr:4Fe-4S dicluster domain-containing protein [Candidatus Obscuribacterales bacterium]
MERFYCFSKDKFLDFFKALESFGTVQAPVRVTDQSFAFRAVKEPKEIAFEALRTILPPKKFFYPGRETLVSWQGNEVKDHQPEIQKQVLFGVHPCDLAGLGIMDTIFSAEPQDNHYLLRREATIVVGLSCMPDKHCFCKSMGTDTPDSSAYDIFLTDIGEEYFIEIKTPRAYALFENDQLLLKPITEEHREKYKDFWLKRSEAFQIGFASDNLRATMDMEWDNPVWEELGNRCLSCGNCVPVCPTCYCFDVIDVASLHEDGGERIREWDACQFTGFAKVAGDFNFRPGPVDRLKFWYRHKLHGFEDPHGMPTCVGCGRCTVSCPSGIDDIVGTVLRLQAKVEEEPKKGPANDK